MSKFYYARMKFEAEDGFYQIEIDKKGRSLIRQWHPDTPDTMDLFKKWGAVEVTMKELDAIYAEGNRRNYEDYNHSK